MFLHSEPKAFLLKPETGLRGNAAQQINVVGVSGKTGHL